MNMSQSRSYENYTVTSQDYDLTRVPVGIEVILGGLVYATKRPLSDLHLLDAGCGTGNYTFAMSQFVGHVTGLEINEGMLARAAEKTASLKNVTVMQGDITNMPLQDTHFDGICCNQVIHHLNSPATADFPETKKFITESFRVLKPGGCLVLNVHSPEQSTGKSMWYYSLLPDASKRQASRLPKISTLQTFMKEASFSLGPTVNLSEMIFQEEHWLDKEGPFRQEWRNTDSIFSLATPEELEAMLKMWRARIDDGTADDYLKECEEERLRLGITVSIVAYKPK